MVEVCAQPVVNAPVKVAVLVVRVLPLYEPKVWDGGAGERFDDARTATITGCAFAVQVRTSGQVRNQASGRRSGSANDVGGVVLCHRQAVIVNLVGNGSNGGLQNAVAEHVQGQGQVLRGELGVNVELG